MKKRILIIISVLVLVIIFSGSAMAVDPPANAFYGPSKDSPILNEIGNFVSNNEFAISLFTGAIIYNYKIEVPLGTRGLSPILSIFYNHQSENLPGTLGTGWFLTENYIQRDINYTRNKTSDDKFNLIFNGQLHNLVYNISDDRYHTKIESFLFIKNISGGNNTNILHWIVKTKDGTSYRFGFNNNSEQLSNQENYTYRWYLDLINDTYNNKIYFSYKENLSSGDRGITYPYLIEYNTDKLRKIEFVFEGINRPDIFTYYDQGNLVNITRRLKEIQLKANNSLVRKYILNYDYLDTRSFLKNITVYGSDNSSMLYSNSFSYYLPEKGWYKVDYWESPYTFIGDAYGDVYDKGVRFSDINRDGYIDIIKGYKNVDGGVESTEIRINNKSGGWINDSSSNFPFSFVMTKIGWICGQSQNAQYGIDRGMRLEDLNNDGIIDLLVSPHDCVGDNQIDDELNNTAYIGLGNSTWIKNSTWKFPPGKGKIVWCRLDYDFCKVHFGVDQGVRFTDINGDSFPDFIGDLGTLQSEERWINNKSTWEKSDNWFLGESSIQSSQYDPSCATQYGIDKGVRFVDLNSDNLADVIISRGASSGIGFSKKRIYLNNGKNFTLINWSIPEYFVDDYVFGDPICNTRFGVDQGIRLVDVNGDSFTDIVKGKGSNIKVYLNNGSGWIYNSDYVFPTSFVSSTLQDEAVRLIDVNGDGLIDVVKAESGNKTTWLNNASHPYLLKNITTQLGGIISIDYKKSTDLDNTGNDSLSDLGFNLWVVANITKNNGMNGSHNITSVIYYNYSDGKYDYQDKEFRGFNYVEEKIENKIIRHFFHQEDGNKGREYEMQILDNNSNNYSKKEFSWNVTSKNGYFITLLTEEADYTYDNKSSNPKIKNISYSYDDFGNIIKKYYKGDVNNANDDRYEYFVFVYNTSSWIVDKIKNYTFADINNNRIRNTLYFYDNLNYGQAPTKGSLTTKEDWLNNGINPTTNYTYNSFGNIINETDANGKVTQYIYGIRDTTNTFVDSIVNPKGHVTNYNYDLGTGNLLWEIDSNGFVTNYTYDVFGRILKEIKPYDNVNYPTKEYIYEWDGIAPEEIKISYRETNNTANTYDEYSFYDGFKNLIQTKKEAETLQQIVTDNYYNEFFQIKNQSNPYFVNFFGNYTTPNTSIASTKLVYDVLDRITEITYPDGTKKNTTYFHWNVTFYDENGNKKEQSTDAYEQIIEVKEHNNGGTYLTTYSYNSAGNLLGIKDSLNNTLNYSYDSLGRKISMKDPDLGTWNYDYDTVGNLINQTDNRSIVIKIGYDELNRITYKNSSKENITYTYDTNKNNTLSQIRIVNDNFKINTTINFSYDDRLRKIEEKTQINNLIFVSNWTYDSLDRITKIGLPDRDSVTYNYNNQNLLSKVSGINITYNEKNQPLSKIYTASLITNLTYNNQNFRLTKIQTDTKQNLNYVYDNVGNVININDTANDKIYSMEYDDLDRLIYTNISETGNEEILNYTYNRIGNLIQIIHNGNNITLIYGSKPIHAPSDTREIIILPSDNKKFYLRNLTNNAVAWLDNKGNIVLQGQCSASVPCNSPGDNSFIVRNSSNTNVAFINSSGDLCLVGGSCEDNYVRCNNAGDGSFIIRNSSNANMSYINRIGSLCLLGSLIQNINVDNGERNYSLIYDNNGNLIQDDNQYYEYNDFNQLIRVREKSATGSIKEEYVYDSDGRRILKNIFVNNGNETIYYIGDNFVQVRNNSGVFNTTYYYADNTLIAEKDILGNKKYYHPDHLGSTTLITNSTGNIVEETFYLPFGEVLSGGSESRYNYNSKEKDSTNLNYYGARYYKATQGQFVQPDSLLPDVYDPQQLNRYSYVRNNPYRYIDESGEFSIDIEDITRFGMELWRQMIYVGMGGFFGSTELFIGEVRVSLGSYLRGILPEIEFTGVSIRNTLDDTTNIISQSDDLSQQFNYLDGISKSSNVITSKGISIKPNSVLRTNEGNFITTKHGSEQAQFRGVSKEDIVNTLNEGEKFSYFHEGLQKIGYYDSQKKLFVATVQDVGERRIVTVINNVKRTYINKLKGG